MASEGIEGGASKADFDAADAASGVDGDASERLRVLVHDLRNAINMLAGSTQVLTSGALGGVAQAQERLLRRMGERTRSMAHMLEDLEGLSSELGQGRSQSAPGPRDDRDTVPYQACSTPTAWSTPAGNTTTAVPDIGEVVDNAYRVEVKIGEGGMGTVFRARDVRLERDVALKIVSASAWPTVAARTHFLEEARTLARVRHPNVVAIYALGTFRDNPYFVMELVQGENLRQLLRQRRAPLRLDEAMAVLDQLCRGVSAIHRAGTVHRDLKPSNVLIGPAFRVAIADLGLAQPLGRPIGEVIRGGTPGYSAPEVFRGDRDALDERVDVYGLGALAFELLSGKRPFAGDRAVDIVHLQELGQIPPLEGLRPDAPPELARIVRAALAPSPADRPASAEALRAALLAAAAPLREDFLGTRVDVVDDDDDVRQMTMRLIERLLPGSSLRGFGDGRAAAQAALRSPPDLLIVDLEMPKMNGVELTALMRSEPRTRNVAVLVITGVGSGRDWALLQKIGADGFLVKPIDVESLGALARNLVGRRSRKDALASPPAFPAVGRREMRLTPIG